MRSDHDPVLLDRLAGLLSEVTGAPQKDLGLHSSPDNTRGWDSHANLQFITTVEEEFGVIIPTAAAMKLRSLADMLEFLQQAAAAEGAAAQGRAGQG